MKLFVSLNGDAPSVITKSSGNLHVNQVRVTCYNSPLYYVCFADTENNFVRTRVPSSYAKTYRKLISELFQSVNEIGKYESGFYGFEFVVPEITVSYNVLTSK